MSVLQFETRATRKQPLTVPAMLQVLWRIADECRPDPVMHDFVQLILVATEELMTLREAAYLAALEADTQT